MGDDWVKKRVALTERIREALELGVQFPKDRDWWEGQHGQL